MFDKTQQQVKTNITKCDFCPYSTNIDGILRCDSLKCHLSETQLERLIEETVLKKKVVIKSDLPIKL